MNTHVIARLLWKEFRQQQAFWLCLTGGAIGLVMLLLMVTEHPMHQFMSCCAVAVYLPICFVLGSVSLSFAGERDEQTDVLLCRLAAPPLTMLLTKMFVAVAGSVAMWLLLAPATSLLLTIRQMPIPFGLWLTPHLWRSHWNQLGPSGMLETTTLLSWLIGFLSWGLLLSLICQRVTTCLIASVVASATGTVLINLAFDLAKTDGDTWALIMRLVIVPVVLFATSFWLVRRWPEGRWPRVIERWSDRLHGWRSRGDRLAEQERNLLCLEQDMRAKLRSIGLPGDVADEIADRTDSSVSRSTRFDAWLVPEWRAVWRIAWLEMKRAKRVLVVGLVVIVGSLVLTSWAEKQQLEAFEWLPNLLFGLSALACGMSLFLPDHRQRQFSFYTNQSASPFTIWATKLCIWWPLAVLLSMTPFLIAAITHASAINTRMGRWTHHISAAEFAFLGNRLDWLPRLWHFLRQCSVERYLPGEGDCFSTLNFATVMSRWLLLITLLFAFGQLVTALIPRAIVAISVGILGSLFVAFLFATSLLVGVPLWLSVLPIIVALLFAAGLRWRDWLNERRPWPAFGQAALIISVSLLTTHLAVGWYRVAEIPAMQLPLPPDLTKLLSIPAAGEQTANLYRAVQANYVSKLVFTTAHQVHSRQYDELFQLGWQLTLSTQDLENPEQVKDNEPLAWKVAEIAERTDCYWKPRIHHDLQASWVTVDGLDPLLHRLAVPIKFLALRLAEEGDADKALRLVQTLRNMARHARQFQGRFEVLDSLSIDVAAYDVLRTIIARTSLTDQQILVVAKILSAPIFDLAWEHESVFADRLIADQVVQLATQGPRFRFERWIAPWEITRLHRLVQVLAVDACQRVFDGAALGRFSTPQLEDWVHTTENIRWVATASLVKNSNPDSYIQFEDRHRINDVVTRQAACRVTLNLMQHRKQHGQWPERLELQPDQPVGWQRFDPWTECDFSYWPEGLPVTVRFSNATIQKGTPCFFSGGVHHARLVKQWMPDKNGVVQDVWTFNNGQRTDTGNDLAVNALGFALEP